MKRIFEERERAFEAKWAHDEETHFKIMAKCNATLGGWAAQAMKLPADEASEYVQAIIGAGLTGKGMDFVISKIRSDFAARKIDCPDFIIHDKMQEALEQSIAAIMHKN